MSDKVNGRGNKISPVNKNSKVAYSYSPCPKIDPDYLGIPALSNGKLYSLF